MGNHPWTRSAVPIPRGRADTRRSAPLSHESYGELMRSTAGASLVREPRLSCKLVVLIEDATSRLMQLRFVPSESTDSYFEALQGYRAIRERVAVDA